MKSGNARLMGRPSAPWTSSKKISDCRRRSSDSRATTPAEPRASAARRLAESAKNTAHSVSSGATCGSTSHTLRSCARRLGLLRAASKAAAARNAAR